MDCLRNICINTLHKGDNDDDDDDNNDNDDDDNNNNNNNNNIYGPKFTKNAVFCASLPHLVCIKHSFKLTNIIIYAKQISVHVK